MIGLSKQHATEMLVRTLLRYTIVQPAVLTVHQWHLAMVTDLGRVALLKEHTNNKLKALQMLVSIEGRKMKAALLASIRSWLSRTQDEARFLSLEVTVHVLANTDNLLLSGGTCCLCGDSEWCTAEDSHQQTQEYPFSNHSNTFCQT